VAVLASYYMEVIIHLSVPVTASIITIGSFITIPGYWVNGAISEFIGRRYAGILGTVLALVGTVLFAISAKTYVALLITYAFSSFWINGNFANVINYVNEMVPTRIRGTVNVLSTGFGQLGWGIVDLIYGSLIKFVGISGDMAIIAIAFFAVAIGIFLTGPKIKVGEPLEDIAI
ncbi:MFS transporter, partial [Thermoplasma sp.]|uniref:MFS transporter n=1 Tax=Thermoplasma sp. TaxID=1973142 RepID=UPI002614D137